MLTTAAACHTRGSPASPAAPGLGPAPVQATRSALGLLSDYMYSPRPTHPGRPRPGCCINLTGSHAAINQNQNQEHIGKQLSSRWLVVAAVVPAGPAFVAGSGCSSDRIAPPAGVPLDPPIVSYTFFF